MLETVRHAWRFATWHRRARKRDFRKLWIIRINAAARDLGTTYSKLIHGLSQANIKVDRKILADLAISDPVAFRSIVQQAGIQVQQAS
jgi:large subunit ribosomal protein L20